jgi:hypothetical protein
MLNFGERQPEDLSNLAVKIGLGLRLTMQQFPSGYVRKSFADRFLCYHSAACFRPTQNLTALANTKSAYAFSLAASACYTKQRTVKPFNVTAEVYHAQNRSTIPGTRFTPHQ